MKLIRIKSFILIIAIFLSVISFHCSEKYDSGSDLYTKDGLIYKIGENKPFTGIVKGKANNNTVQYEVKNGLKNGEFILYFPNGHIAIKGNIIDNKNEGEWEYYYPDNMMESHGDFKNDLVDGEWVWYFPNGILKEEGKYVDGKREGEWQTFNDNGILYIKRYFKDNAQVDSVK